MTIRCERLAPPHLPALAALFARADSGCHCEWWHFAGDKNAWLERLATNPDANRACLAARAAAPSLEGLVAFASDERAIGWMKLCPAARLPKLYAQRPYRALPGLAADPERTFSVGCFLIDPDWRKRGVATALLREGIRLAREAGALAVEAFPRRAELMRDEEAWTGPCSLYEREGFLVVHEQAQYPVLRLLL